MQRSFIRSLKKCMWTKIVVCQLLKTISYYINIVHNKFRISPINSMSIIISYCTLKKLFYNVNFRNDFIIFYKINIIMYRKRSERADKFVGLIYINFIMFNNLPKEVKYNRNSQEKLLNIYSLLP